MRALRHRLREYLTRVEGGEGFEVTVFGRIVAQLQPASSRTQGLTQLIADGRVTPAMDPHTMSLPTPLTPTTRTTATAALIAERRGDER